MRTPRRSSTCRRSTPSRRARASGRWARVAAPRSISSRLSVPRALGDFRSWMRTGHRSKGYHLRIIAAPARSPSSMPRRTPTFHASPYLLLTLTILFWSINWVIGRAITGHVSPLAFTFIRWVGALAVMLPFAWPQVRDQWPAIRRRWRLIAWLGFWGTGLHNMFAYAGLQYTTATNGVILNSSVPIMIIVIGWLVYRDTITRLQALGVAVSLAGVLAILMRGDPAILAQLRLNKGDLIVVAGMVFWAAYTVFLRMKPPEISGLALLACCATVGVVLLLPLFVAEMVFFGGHVELTFATAAE